LPASNVWSACTPLPPATMSSSYGVSLAEIVQLPTLTIQSWMPNDLKVRVVQPNHYFDGSVNIPKVSKPVPNWANIDNLVAPPFPDQRVVMPGVGTNPTAPATATVSLAQQLYQVNKEGNPYSVNVLQTPSPLPASPMQTPYMTLEYEGAFYQYTSANDLLYTFTKSTLSAAGSAPAVIYGAMLPATASNTFLPSSPAILQFVPAQSTSTPTPPTLLLQNSTPFALSVGTVTVPPGTQTNITSIANTAAVTAPQVPSPPAAAAGAPQPPPISNAFVVSGFTPNAALVGAGVACPQTYLPFFNGSSRTNSPVGFDVRMTANGATGVVTATVIWQGMSTGVLYYVYNSTPYDMQLTATDNTNGVSRTGAFAVVLSDSDPSLVTGTYVLTLAVQAGSILAVSMADASGQGTTSSVSAYQVTCKTSTGLSVQSPSILSKTGSVGSSTWPLTSPTSPPISNLCTNWWLGTPASKPFYYDTYITTVGAVLLPTLRQAASQVSLLLTTSPLIVLQPSGTGLSTVGTGAKVIVPASLPVPMYPPELLVPVDHTYMAGGGAANAPAGLPPKRSGAQQLITVAPLPLLNIDGGFVLKIIAGNNGSPVSVPSSPLDGGVGNRWQSASDYGAITFFLPAFVQAATAPASPLSSTSTAANNVYIAQPYSPSSTPNPYQFDPQIGGSSLSLPVWVDDSTTPWRVVLNVSFSVPEDAVGSSAQYLQNVCGGNGFTDCRPVGNRAQSLCIGYFDNTVGPLCQSIVLDSASGDDISETNDAFLYLSGKYCGSTAPGRSMDACACLAADSKNVLNSPTRWSLPGASGSSISFPEYVAKYNAQGFGSMPALMTSASYAPCWWPPCTGATPALVPLASTRGACTGTVTNCFGAINSVVVDKTSKVKKTIVEACSPPDPGGGGKVSGTRRRGTSRAGARTGAGTGTTANAASQSWQTPGAIAGIAVGCVVVAGVIGVGVWLSINSKGKAAKRNALL